MITQADIDARKEANTDLAARIVSRAGILYSKHPPSLAARLRSERARKEAESKWEPKITR